MDVLTHALGALALALIAPLAVVALAVAWALAARGSEAMARLWAGTLAAMISYPLAVFAIWWLS